MEQFLLNNYYLLLTVLIFWCLPWKAIALWKAARNNHKIWFIILFLLNTLAVLDIIYILVFRKKKSDIKK